MNSANRISWTAALIGDPSRTAILCSLLGGESRPATELAMLANVSPQTASNHLRMLLNAGLLKVAVVGRNKFYRLSGPAVATALESLAVAVPGTRCLAGAAEQSAPELVFARTCYDHLAGELGVEILNRLQAKDYLRERSEGFALTAAGEDFLQAAGIDVARAQAQRRRFAYGCLDWSHHVPHLGGALGAALLDWLLRSRILVRRRASRAVRLTDMGEKQMDRFFGIRTRRNGIAIAHKNEGVR